MIRFYTPPLCSPLTKGGIKEGLLSLCPSSGPFDYHHLNSDNQSLILDEFVMKL
jgi:hypothetical protein